MALTHKLAPLALLVLSSLVSAHAATNAPILGSIYDYEIERINGPKAGAKEKISEYRGKVLLITNTASQCGFTPQYENLQKTFDKYKDRGFVVLGFPSNDFGAQEPGSNAEIKSFCERKFKVSFPMFSKGKVGGKDDRTGEDLAQPLYRYLLKNTPASGPSGPVEWNFEKFLVGRDGKILARYRSSTTPDSEEVTKAIEAALATAPAAAPAAATTAAPKK